MPQSLSRVLVHLVFSTKHRVPSLTDDIQHELHAYLIGVLNQIDCPTIRVGGVADHVHLFFGLSRRHSVAEVVEITKTSSSKWIKTKGRPFKNFHWQAGYGAFSISQSHTDRLVAYIDNQAEHHRTHTFQDEFRRMLMLYRVEFDERYVWD